MLSTWIESAGQGRHGGPVRAGMWGAVVVGTHPVESEQDVWLELWADELVIGPLPAYWLENRGVNSLWHVPIPPQAVGTRLRYRSAARREGQPPAFSAIQEVRVRPNLPDRTESPESSVLGIEGLVGNQMMTARVDARGSTFDIFYPTVGLHSDVRPAEGDQPQSRVHFQTIVGGLAVGHRLDWFSERLSWNAFQHYQGATNLLVTELKWRRGPLRVLATDFVVMGPELPRTAGGTPSSGQYLKRFRIINDGPNDLKATFGIYIQAEVNGGIGDVGLSWHDEARALLATNRGHGHANRKLARDATVQFALGLDDRGLISCEPTGPNEAILLRAVELAAGATVHVNLLVSGAFTGWRGDQGTFEYWLRPALNWFRGADLDQLEHETAEQWDRYVEPIPTVSSPRPVYAVALRRSALVAALHCDAKWGAIASAFDRGLNAYCWPRDAMWASYAFARIGHPEVGSLVLDWLGRVRGQTRAFSHWFQKYTIDGWPEWESPAIDQTALIPWVMEQHYQRTSDLGFVNEHWKIVEQASKVCVEGSGHPGMRWLEPVSLITSAGIWGRRFGAFLYGNACAVAGLRAAARLAGLLNKPENIARRWQAHADRIWEQGIRCEAPRGGDGPGLIDPETGRFFEARRVSNLRHLWTDQPDLLSDCSRGLDVSLLVLSVPLNLLPAADPALLRTATAILEHNTFRGDPNALTSWASDPKHPSGCIPPSEGHRDDLSCLATLWTARYLIQLGRETGDASRWLRALDYLDAMIMRLCPLGVSLRPGPKGTEEAGPSARHLQGVWGLHAMLMETVLDLAGLDVVASARRVVLDPVLPPNWSRIGLDRPISGGQVGYLLQRPVGRSTYQLRFEAQLEHPMTLEVHLTCPGLRELGPWTSRPSLPPPRFDTKIGRLEWSLELPSGTSSFEWSWGKDSES